MTCGRVAGDGNCLFHSLSHGLRRAEVAEVGSRRLRQALAQFIQANPALLISETPLHQWVRWDSGLPLHKYTQRIAGSAWGGGIEIAACSRLFKVCGKRAGSTAPNKEGQETRMPWPALWAVALSLMESSRPRLFPSPPPPPDHWHWCRVCARRDR